MTARFTRDPEARQVTLAALNFPKGGIAHPDVFRGILGLGKGVLSKTRQP